MPKPFTQVNVFSADPLGGNPLAVVHTAEGLSEAQMAAPRSGAYRRGTERSADGRARTLDQLI